MARFRNLASGLGSFSVYVLARPFDHSYLRIDQCNHSFIAVTRVLQGRPPLTAHLFSSFFESRYHIGDWIQADYVLR